MAFENYNIRQFINACFNNDFSEISEDDFSIVYSEYLDESGLFMSDSFEERGAIHRLNSRINYVKLFIRLQRQFIDEFDMPFIRDFENIKNNYGYSLKWNNDKDDFEKQLSKIEMKEVKYEDTLKKKIDDFVKKNSDKEDKKDKEVKLSRTSFIRMINSLSKIGYRIDKDKTTVEELAIMIKQQLEENQNISSNYGR